MGKILLTTTALFTVFGLTLPASSSSSGSRNPDSVSAFSSCDSNRGFRPPVKGETQAQVRARYDDPDQVLKNSEGGDIWLYVFGKDEILGNEKLFMPSYRLFARVRALSIHFDQAGRVTSWKTAYIAFSK